MAGFFLPRHWRLSKVVWILLLLEFPFTVANLTLFGIASPNTYRTKLWQEGGNHGFNSDPSTILYAYANYRPVNIPLVWSSFMTQYNLVIGVLSMFIWLTKVTGFMLHAFFPIISLLTHALLTALWAESIHVQVAPDTIDPKRINNGAPWYITKSCSLSSTSSIKGYCQQAKAAFIVSVFMLAISVIHLFVAGWSLWPTKEQKEAHASKVAEKKAEKEKFSPSSEMTADEQWQHMWELQQLPRTPGTIGGMKSPYSAHGVPLSPLSPTTPRTRAFNQLGGGGDLPLRSQQYQYA